MLTRLPRIEDLPSIINCKPIRRFKNFFFFAKFTFFVVKSILLPLVHSIISEWHNRFKCKILQIYIYIYTMGKIKKNMHCSINFYSKFTDALIITNLCIYTLTRIYRYIISIQIRNFIHNFNIPENKNDRSLLVHECVIVLATFRENMHNAFFLHRKSYRIIRKHIWAIVPAIEYREPRL